MWKDRYKLIKGKIDHLIFSIASLPTMLYYCVSFPIFPKVKIWICKGFRVVEGDDGSKALHNIAKIAEILIQQWFKWR